MKVIYYLAYWSVFIANGIIAAMLDLSFWGTLIFCCGMVVLCIVHRWGYDRLYRQIQLERVIEEIISGGK